LIVLPSLNSNAYDVRRKQSCAGATSLLLLGTSKYSGFRGLNSGESAHIKFEQLWWSHQKFEIHPTLFMGIEKAKNGYVEF